MDENQRRKWMQKKRDRKKIQHGRDWINKDEEKR
jgi:hypothetical protein